jgi:hypothetical protein
LPDTDNALDERIGTEDESSDGVASEELGKVGEKHKGKGKAKARPKKARREHEERDGSSEGVYEMSRDLSFFLNLFSACNRCAVKNILCVMLPGKTACDNCHKSHIKCSLRPQSSKCVSQVKASCIAEEMASLGQESAVTHQAVSHVGRWTLALASCCCTVRVDQHLASSSGA